MSFPLPGRLPNPYDTQPPNSVPPPSSPALTTAAPQVPRAQQQQQQQSPAPQGEDPAYLAAIEASRASAAEEAAARLRAQAEEDQATLARISALSLASAQSEAAAASEQEAAQLRSVMNASLQAEAERRARAEAEAREEVRRAMEASRAEEERRKREEEEVMRVAMIESAEEHRRQEEERRRRMEMERQEQQRREEEARRLAQEQWRPEMGRSMSQSSRSSRGSARPLPPVPQPQTQQSEVTSLNGDSVYEDPVGEEAEEGDDDSSGDDPFADSAEAPPEYSNVYADRPPEAPSRAPTGMWDEVRARHMAAEAAAALGTNGQQRAPTDPIEEKRRMEALGARRTASPEAVASTSATPINGNAEAGPSTSTSAAVEEKKSPSVSTGSSVPLGLSWGWSTHPFATSLDQGEQASSSSSSSAPSFPSTISLHLPSGPSCSTFTLRSGSWRLLLRALAWLGNTPITSAHEADTSTQPRLLVDVELVTPTPATQAQQERSRQQGGGGRHAWPSAAPVACVAVSLRLSTQPPASSIAAAHSASRELDSEYTKHGSRRNVLPTTSGGAGLRLPCTLLDVAQHLSACRGASAQSGGGGRRGENGHSASGHGQYLAASQHGHHHIVPALAHRIEEHDLAFIERGPVRRGIDHAVASQLGRRALLDSFFATTVPRGRERVALLEPPGALLPQPGGGDDDDGDDKVEYGALALDGEGGGEGEDEDDASPSSRRQRMRDRMRRIYHGDEARRGAAGGDGELANWITPLDLSRVG